MGRALPFWRIHNRTGRDGPVKSRVYQCPGGVDCPLASECVAGKTGRRSVAHDDCEHHRRAMDARLASDRGRKTYARRKWIAETPFGIIKAQMGLRQFLLRGLEKVKAEWLWACTAFNLAKLVRNGVAVRAYIATTKLKFQANITDKFLSSQWLTLFYPCTYWVQSPQAITR